jgi:hypothetical protein
MFLELLLPNDAHSAESGRDLVNFLEKHFQQHSQFALFRPFRAHLIKVGKMLETTHSFSNIEVGLI